MSINTASHAMINPKIRTHEAQQPRPLPKVRPNNADHIAAAQRMRRHEAAAAQTNAENTASQPQGLSIDGLMDAWGLSDSNYDLNGDGTVNVQDLLQMLSGGEQSSSPNETAANSPITTSNTADGSSAGAANNEDVMVITPDTMAKAFGSDNAAYDLTGDGTVNVNDLLELLANGGKMRVVAPDQSANGEASAADPNNETFTVTTDGVMKAYGTSNEMYDLNGDGTVNVSDLLEVLANGGEMKVSLPGSEEASDSNDSAGPDAFVINTDNLTEAFGTDNQTFDLNGDGTVNVSDLLELLANGGQIRVTPDSPGARAGAEIAGGQLNDQQVNQLGDALIEGFEQSGFTSRPPSNLPDLLSQFDLSRHDRSSLLSQIRQRYPQGLGVNLFG